MDSSFINSANLYYNSLFYKELKVKHLKTIYKCLIGNDIDINILFANLNNILIQLTSLSEEKIKKISVVDFFLLLFEIRCSSIGDLIFAEVNIKEKNTKIEISIPKILQKIKSIDLSFLLQEETIDRFVIEYDLPSIDKLIYANEQHDAFLNIFVKSVKTKNTTISFTDIESNNIDRVFNKLPVKVTTKIFKRSTEIIKYFNELNLLDYLPEYTDIRIPLNFNIKNLAIIIKLLFGNQLLSLYENIFALCKIGNFTPEYIENCTPGEYLLLVKKLEEMNKRQESGNSIPGVYEGDAMNEASPFVSTSMPPRTSQAVL